MAIVNTRGNQVRSSSEATSHTNTFGFTATAGRLLFAYAATKAGANPVMSTAGWNRCMPNPASGRIGSWYKISDGTETAFTLNHSLTTSCWCDMREYTGADPLSPLDVAAEASGVGAVMDMGSIHFTAPDDSGYATALFTYTDAASYVSGSVGWSALGNSTTTNGSPNVLVDYLTLSLDVPISAGPTVTLDTSVTWQGMVVTFKGPLPPNLPAPMQSVR